VTWSVVIATHTEQRWDYLADAIGSALSQEPAPLEVIVVVDHNPTLLERVQAEYGDRIVAVGNRQRRGPSGSRNTGAEVASGDLVAYLDDDARGQVGWLSAMAASFSDETVVGVGGLAAPHWETGSAPSWLPEEFYWVVGCHYRGHRTTAGPVRAPIGANMAFRRDRLVEVGGFTWQVSRPPYARCEETELAIRLAATSGGKVWFEPGAVVLHSVSASRTTWRYFVRRCRLEGQAKADLSVHLGTQSATSVERGYAIRTLGGAVGRYLKGGLSGRGTDLVRAANVVVGLAVTVFGFAEGHLLRLASQSSGRTTEPTIGVTSAAQSLTAGESTS
jgi:glucosyl-dolichyl phosphate glucuronosyltransferase